ncbi:hypothetical protein [Romboutsia ilealis]|uniref:hypothetical protein n=1 Tax=Romboutsia ilealis TaxID=1115758 RepID=UPI0025733B43|nr:hypothetical protein [Romboutsia ilealis]
MKFPLMLRSTHETELKTAIEGLKCKSRLIDSLNATLNNKLHEINCLKHEIEDLELEIKGRDLSIDKLLIELEQKDKKLKKLEEYIEKLEQVSENKTLRNCSLNTKLIEKDAELKKLDKANKDLDDANKKLIELFNDANRKNWCNNESSRQLKRLSEEIIESDKINKTNLATYIYNISQYVGGGIPAEIKVMDDIK